MEMGLPALKYRLKIAWMQGDYDRFARYLKVGAAEFFEQLDVSPGVSLLDVGCGSGQLAMIAARAGVHAVGVDLAPNWLERARARAAEENVGAEFREGDAEALPFEDASFDYVTSTFGAMFAPQPDLVAAELVRVCKRGGTIAMRNWTPSGFAGQMYKVLGKHVPHPSMPSPLLWGDEAVVRQRFQGKLSWLRMTRKDYTFEYPYPPASVVELFRENYGPVVAAFLSLNCPGRRALRADLDALWTRYNECGSGTTSVRAEYLEILAGRV